MTLTSDEITYVRNSIGDTDASNYDLNDTYLNYLDNNQADGDTDAVIVYALRALLGLAARKVSQANARTGDSKSEQQWFEHLQSLLTFWESRVSLTSGGSVSTGTINLGIDEEDDQFDIT